MRFITFIALVVSACVIAGVYGAIHDQISFTVSSEYFTKFKYIQFGLVYGSFFASHELSDYPGWYLPDDLEKPGRYLSVGHMHNFSYLGGLIGLFVGIVFQFVLRTKRPPSYNYSQ